MTYSLFRKKKKKKIVSDSAVYVSALTVHLHSPWLPARDSLWKAFAQ